ncbi:hypothetical protein AWH49_08740 [Domibacillus aminovorans]|uniref:PTS EIIB type-2 domain-containing protein n=1 Tax=Domibacillus aminovorans TaxID=29332 RepID=A0A177LB84_9BACI|nr:hypothetical protein AWH49_08740 [Domibacillus aminovorans]
MAADALRAKAKEKNIHFKVETNGSSGVENALTADEIANATAIIVAADKQVEMERFKGKHVIQVPVAQMGRFNNTLNRLFYGKMQVKKIVLKEKRNGEKTWETYMRSELRLRVQEKWMKCVRWLKKKVASRLSVRCRKRLNAHRKK